MKKMCRMLASILKQFTVFVIDQLKDPKIAIFLFISTALLLFLPESILSHLEIHAFVEGKRRLIGLVFFYSIKCFLAIFVFWALVQVKNRIKTKRLGKSGRLALRELTSKERNFLAGFVVQDTKTQHFDARDDTLEGLIHKNILFLNSNTNRFESKINYNLQSWVWAELKRHQELLEPELSDLVQNMQKA